MGVPAGICQVAAYERSWPIVKSWLWNHFWYAIVAPTGMPPEIVTRLNDAVNAFLRSDKGKAILEQNALQGVGGSPDDLKAFIAGELAKWGPVIAAAKITM